MRIKIRNEHNELVVVLEGSTAQKQINNIIDCPEMEPVTLKKGSKYSCGFKATADMKLITSPESAVFVWKGSTVLVGDDNV